MTAEACLTINLQALAANYRLLQAKVAPAQVAGVVKANAYGLGVIPVVRTLIAQGCQHFFVALLSEAREIVHTISDGISVFVLNGLLPGQEDECAKIGAIPVLNSLDQVQRWNRSHPTAPCALQIDTGMSRMGLPENELAALRADPELLNSLNLRLVMSHLTSSDEPLAPANAEQVAKFTAITQAFASIPCALDNSGGAFQKRAHFDLVRAGIALYGGAPNDAANPMAPVITLEAAITQIRTITAGTSVGYSQTHRVQRDSKIATISVGYADGLPRTLSNKAKAYIQGHCVSLVGRVSMDSITLDVTDVPDDLLYAGAVVELIGSHQSLDDLAKAAGTISYEILTQLSPRYARRYV